MSIRATSITRLSVPTGSICARCPVRLNGPRSDSQSRPMCKDCREVEALLEKAERRGIDLAELHDDDFYLLDRDLKHFKRAQARNAA